MARVFRHEIGDMDISASTGVRSRATYLLMGSVWDMVGSCHWGPFRGHRSESQTLETNPPDLGKERTTTQSATPSTCWTMLTKVGWGGVSTCTSWETESTNLCKVRGTDQTSTRSA